MLFGEVQRHGRRWECHTHWSKLFSLSVSPSERRIQDIQTASWRIVSHCQSVVADLPGTAIGCRHHCLSERLSQRPRHLRYSSKLHLVLPSSMRFENAVKHTGAFELIQTVCGSSPLPSETAPLLCSACHYPTGDCPGRLCPGLPSGMHDGRWPFPTYDRTLPPSVRENETEKKTRSREKGLQLQLQRSHFD